MDLKSIIEQHGLDKAKLASELFPTNAYPEKALARVISGEGLLHSDQISKLSQITGASVDSFFSEGWNANYSDKIHTFSRGKYVVKLNIETWVSEIYEQNELKSTKVLGSSGVKLSDYFSMIEDIISHL